MQHIPLFRDTLYCDRAEPLGSGTPSQKGRYHWNTEMLAYTLYAADDYGRVTIWDLKPLLLELAHMWVLARMPRHQRLTDCERLPIQGRKA